MNLTHLGSFVAAMAFATGSAGLEAASDAADPALRLGASRQVRCAQVELYCAHPAQALQAIRHARDQLRSVGGSSFAELDRAALAVRRHTVRGD